MSSMTGRDVIGDPWRRSRERMIPDQFAEKASGTNCSTRSVKRQDGVNLRFTSDAFLGDSYAVASIPPQE
jgi:hypothetical protein